MNLLGRATEQVTSARPLTAKHDCSGLNPVRTALLCRSSLRVLIFER